MIKLNIKKFNFASLNLGQVHFFGKKGYFPEAHLDLNGIRQYKDLTEEEREQFIEGFLQGRKTSK
jgi:hypothetical protein